jgi:hypothetical protein
MSGKAKYVKFDEKTGHYVVTTTCKVCDRPFSYTRKLPCGSVQATCSPECYLQRMPKKPWER